MNTKQGALINSLIAKGVHLPTHHMNKYIKIFNNWEKPIGERCKEVTENPDEFINYLKEKGIITE